MGATMEKWKNFLIAIDEMESALKAVRYVGRLGHDITNISICLLNIYPAPPPDFFVNGGTLDNYQKERLERAQKIFDHGIKILLEFGIDRNAIFCTTHMAEEKTISDTLLEVRRMGNFGTVVTGKRGVSKAEEFLFGSISNALARHCNDFTVWIVG